MGLIFDIQHFCTNDGPGVRTTVFLKGCSLHCAWCHNPESQKPEPEIMVNEQLCLKCDSCERICPRHDSHHILHQSESRSEFCRGCLKCQSVCPSGALELAGREVSAGDVISEVLMDKSYYDYSGGGITLSGGEPFFQSEFSLELLKRSKEAGVGTAVETSGNGSKEDYLASLPYVDLFLWDVKLMDTELYRHFTGGSLDRMVSNLEALSDRGASVVLRVLFIPEIHLQESVLGATVRFLERFPGFQREVIPYHVLGNSKRIKLGLPEIRFREPDADETARFSRSVL